MSFEYLSPLATQLGFGGVVGFVVGFALKMMFKIVLVFIGLYFVSLQYLAYKGYISVNYDKISEGFQGLVGMMQEGFTLPAFITSNIPFLGSFIVGFGIGFKVC